MTYFVLGLGTVNVVSFTRRTVRLSGSNDFSWSLEAPPPPPPLSSASPQPPATTAAASTAPSAILLILMTVRPPPRESSLPPVRHASRRGRCRLRHRPLP